MLRELRVERILINTCKGRVPEYLPTAGGLQILGVQFTQVVAVWIGYWAQRADRHNATVVIVCECEVRWALTRHLRTQPVFHHLSLVAAFAPA